MEDNWLDAEDTLPERTTFKEAHWAIQHMNLSKKCDHVVASSPRIPRPRQVQLGAAWCHLYHLCVFQQQHQMTNGYQSCRAARTSVLKWVYQTIRNIIKQKRTGFHSCHVFSRVSNKLTAYQHVPSMVFRAICLVGFVPFCVAFKLQPSIPGIADVVGGPGPECPTVAQFL